MDVLEASPLGIETLDQSVDPPADVVRATLRDIAVSNMLFGGRQAVRYGLQEVLRQLPVRSHVTLLDVGAGMGDILEYLAAACERDGPVIRRIALERNRVAGRLCSERGIPSLIADGGVLPFSDESVDIVVASQLLHHFSRSASIQLVREMSRTARLGVVIADLRRQWAAASGIWVASMLLRFHEVTRRDAVISVRRGFKKRELQSILRDAGVPSRVAGRPGFRLVAAWTKTNAHA